MTESGGGAIIASMVLARLALARAPLALFAAATMACARSAPTSEGGGALDASPPARAPRLATAPEGYTPCSPDEGPGIDEAMATARQGVWRGGAAHGDTPLRAADVRAVRGQRRYEDYRDDRPAPATIELTLAHSSVRLALPPRLSEVTSDRRGLALAPDFAADEVLHHVVGAALPASARVAFAGGWVSRGSFQGDLRVHVYALASSVADVASALGARGVTAIGEVACSSVESGLHRAAWRASQGWRDGGAWTERLSATLGLSGCTPGDRVHVEVHARPAGGDALVVACTYGAREHSDDCAAIADRARVTPD